MSTQEQYELSSRWEKIRQVSARIHAMREDMVKIVPEIFSDRARLVTESYEKTHGQPIVVRRAKALENVLDHMDICIFEGELIVGGMARKPRGCQVFPEYDMDFIVNELDSFYTRSADRFFVSEDNKEIFRNIHKRWRGNTLSQIAFSLFPSEEKESAKDLIFILTALKSGVGHMIVDYESGIRTGMKYYIRKAESLKNSLDVSDPSYAAKAAYYQAVGIVCWAVIRFSQRYSKLALAMAEHETNLERKKELNQIAEVCATVPAEGARTFHEALQSFWFIHLILHIESNGHSVSPGRFDQYIFPYYETDIKESGVSTEYTEELIHCLWLKFFEINKVRDKVSSAAFGGYPMFQNIIVGGKKADGSESVNELSHLCLEATAKLGLPQPSLSVRWYYGCPEDFFLHVMRVVSFGSGLPAIFNDEVLIPNMLQLGYSLEEARDYAIVGCTETTVPGATEPWLTGGFLNLLKILELTIFDGYDPMEGKQYSFRNEHSIEEGSFDSFYYAFLKRVAHYLKQLIRCDNILDGLHGSLCPTPFESVLINGCLDSGKTSLEGGARYNFSTIEAVGIANVADSLAAIKKIIIEEKKITWTELKDALLNDFDGKEDLRQLLIHDAPKYGNDIDYVDSIGASILDFLWTEIAKYSNPRGGRYNIALYSIATHVLLADKTGATPDGRKRGDVLADGGVSCSHGHDINGLTALLKSVTKLDPYKATGSTLLNVKLNPSVLTNENLKKIADVIKTYFLLKGQHIQFNVIDTKTLRDAQKYPEKFASLSVRVAGFSVLFTTIDPLLQEDIIRRTEHSSGGQM